MIQRILVTGITSIHGYPLYTHCTQNKQFEIVGIRSPKMKVPFGPLVASLCITDRDGLSAIKKSFNPSYVVHCAGVCDLDVCEERPHWAATMNTDGARAVTEVFEKSSHIIYLSSDLVFSGNNPPLGGYNENHSPDPLSVAGTTILAAEKEIQKSRHSTIVRLGLPIGTSVKKDKGAVDFIDYRLRRSRQVTLFHDEWRSCIACEDIAKIVEQCIIHNIEGTFHLGGPTPVSLYDIGKWVLKKGGYDTSLLNTISRFEEINGPPRIGNVGLDSSKLLSTLGVSLICPID